MEFYEKNFTIRYSEVDKNNELTPIGVMQYFQEIGCLHSKHLGMGIDHKYAWIIIQWKVKIVGKANWNDEILVKTWPSGIQGPYCMRDYEMYKGEKLIAIGTSKWVLTDSETHGLVKITEDVKKLFNPVDKQVFDEPIKKIKPSESYTNAMVYDVNLRDIDTNEHVNNIKYIEIAYRMYEGETSNIEVMYKHAAKYGNTLNCYYNDGEVVMKNGEQISAIVRFK